MGIVWSPAIAHLRVRTPRSDRARPRACQLGGDQPQPTARSLIESTTALKPKEKWIEQLKASAKRECRVINNHGGAGALILGQPGVREKLWPCLSVDQITEACRSNPMSLLSMEGVAELVDDDLKLKALAEVKTLNRGILNQLDGFKGSTAWSNAVERYRAEEADATLYQYEQDEEQRLRDETDAHWHAYGKAERDFR